MRETEPKYRKIVLVCTNERMDGRECCAEKGSLELFQKLKMAMAGADPSIRVIKTGCLGHCETGTTVLIMPDNIWLGRVQEQNIVEIISLATT